jgi:predicted RND superfamily exporter protein
MTWLLTRGRFAYLVAVTLVTAFFAWQAAHVGIEQTNASLSSREPTTVATYDRLRTLFGSDEDLLLAVTADDLLEPSGLERLVRLSATVAAMDGVRKVFSLATISQIVPGEAGAEVVPLLPPQRDPASIRRELEAALDRNPDYTGWLISADRRTAGIVIEIDDRADDDEYRATLIASLRALEVGGGDGVSLHLTGIAVQKYDVGALVARDQALLMPLAVAILGAALALFFRNLAGVALPLATTAVSVAVTQGIYGMVGLELNAITALLPPVIMVLAVAVSVHLVQGWVQAADDLRGTERILAVVHKLAAPCFFCSLTTALGFSSLLLAELPAVRQFGLFAALGVVVSFIVGMTLVPVGLSLWPAAGAGVHAVPEHRWLVRLLAASARVSTERPGVILAIFVVLTAAAAAAIPQVRNNTDLVRFLKPTAALFRDTMFIDEHLTGVHALEFLVERRDGAPLVRPGDVARIERFERTAAALPDVAATTSILPVLRQLARAERGDDSLALPTDAGDLDYLFALLEAAEDRSLIDKLLAPDARAARVTVRLHAVGTAVAAPLADRLTASAREIFGADYTVEPTGAFYHVAHDSNRLVRDQVRSFAVGILAVFAAIAFLLRSLRWTAVSLVPNVMPLVWTAGLMGATGIDLSSGTAMIASAVIGLVVDDTIHYLAEYRRCWRGDAREAVFATTTGVGAALVMNNLVLVLGFWVGCFGSFKPTIYFSLLTGLTMISAMLCDLFVTPACLVLMDRRRGQA